MAYIYIYADLNKPGKYKYGDLCFDFEPFYVGKGVGNRWKICEHIVKTSSQYLVNKLNKLQNSVVVSFFNKNLDYNKSSEVEKFIIKTIGRKDLQMGPLINFTDGGEGQCGAIVSKETRQKLSLASIGRKHTEESKQKIAIANSGPNLKKRNRKLSLEHINKIINFHKGKKWRLGQKNSDKQRENISKALLGKPLSEEHKEKCRQAKLKNPVRYWLGKTGPTKGKKHSPEHIEKIRRANKETWRKKHG